MYSVEIVPVETSIQTYGRHYVPISTMLGWAAARNVPVLIINSDIELQLQPWELKRLRWLSDGGLCYFVRYNYAGDGKPPTREPYGIDAFLLHGRDVHLLRESSLSMGLPFWDYWLPYTLAHHDRPIFSVEFPVALHRDHPRQWSWENWHRCAIEFDRITGALGGDYSGAAPSAKAYHVRQSFDGIRTALKPTPGDIKQWVRRVFNDPRPKVFLELGSHDGCDTLWMAALPGVTMHAFEPDPRNIPPNFDNVTLHRAAVADRDGRTSFILSKHGWGQEWTHSSSIKVPKNHIQRYPVTFGEAIEVETVALDTFCERQGLRMIDFVWADLQGAEGEMVRGGRETFARTRYLYTEYSDDELYEDQATLEEILSMLPNFRVIELWPDDVLLANRRFSDVINF